MSHAAFAGDTIGQRHHHRKPPARHFRQNLRLGMMQPDSLRNRFRQIPLFRQSFAQKRMRQAQMFLLDSGKALPFLPGLLDKLLETLGHRFIQRRFANIMQKTCCKSLSPQRLIKSQLTNRRRRTGNRQ